MPEFRAPLWQIEQGHARKQRKKGCARVAKSQAQGWRRREQPRVTATATVSTSERLGADSTLAVLMFDLAFGVFPF